MPTSAHRRRQLSTAAQALAVCASLVSASALALQPQARTPAMAVHGVRQALHPIAVFGTDDRLPLPAKYKDVQQKMGLLFNLRSRTVCTAFCVAPDVVAT